ncbi:exonuclease sbcCD subunit D, partial [Bifidobacterium breve]|nr:exonuclease sbcCD subunit D [Bifidobacterium breve]
VNKDTTNSNTTQHIALETPTPEKLFQNNWEKQGYSADDAVLKDFLSLVQEAQKNLENDATH